MPRDKQLPITRGNIFTMRCAAITSDLQMSGQDCSLLRDVRTKSLGAGEITGLTSFTTCKPAS